MLAGETNSSPAGSPPRHLLPLENGELLHSREFLRRYEQTPRLKKAGLARGRGANRAAGEPVPSVNDFPTASSLRGMSRTRVVVSTAGVGAARRPESWSQRIVDWWNLIPSEPFTCSPRGRGWDSRFARPWGWAMARRAVAPFVELTPAASATAPGLRRSTQWVPSPLGVGRPTWGGLRAGGGANNPP